MERLCTREIQRFISLQIENGVLYIGVTSDLPGRIYQHKNHLADGFSHKYNTSLLVYFESYSTMYEAITREKQLKKWKRCWKILLIEKSNQEWSDLYDTLF